MKYAGDFLEIFIRKHAGESGDSLEISLYFLIMFIRTHNQAVFVYFVAYHLEYIKISFTVFNLEHLSWKFQINFS